MTSTFNSRVCPGEGPVQQIIARIFGLLIAGCRIYSYLAASSQPVGCASRIFTRQIVWPEYALWQQRGADVPFRSPSQVRNKKRRRCGESSGDILKESCFVSLEKPNSELTKDSMSKLLYATSPAIQCSTFTLLHSYSNCLLKISLALSLIKFGISAYSILYISFYICRDMYLAFNWELRCGFLDGNAHLRRHGDADQMHFGSKWAAGLFHKLSSLKTCSTCRWSITGVQISRVRTVLGTNSGLGFCLIHLCTVPRHLQSYTLITVQLTVLRPWEIDKSQNADINRSW